MIRFTIKEVVIEIPVKLFEIYVEQEKARSASVPVPLDYRTVADHNDNQTSYFWKNYIGQKVAIIKQTPDGLLDVMLPDQPIPVEGIAPSRFT